MEDLFRLPPFFFIGDFKMTNQVQSDQGGMSRCHFKMVDFVRAKWTPSASSKFHPSSCGWFLGNYQE